MKPLDPKSLIETARIEVPPTNSDPSIRERLIRDLADALEVSSLSIARLELRPGDALVVKHPDRLSCSQQENLRGYLAAIAPAGVSVLVLDDGADLVVVAAAPCPGCRKVGDHEEWCPVPDEKPAPPAMRVEERGLKFPFVPVVKADSSRG